MIVNRFRFGYLLACIDWTTVLFRNMFCYLIELAFIPFPSDGAIFSLGDGVPVEFYPA